MSRLIYTSTYDVIFNNMITITRYSMLVSQLEFGNIETKTTFDDKKMGDFTIHLTNKWYTNRYNKALTQGKVTIENRGPILSAILQQGVLFSAHDIIVYQILLSHYINYAVDGKAEITLDQIHHDYRNKAFTYNENGSKYDKETLEIYKKTFRKLGTLNLRLNFFYSKLRIFKDYKDKSSTTMFMHNALIIENPGEFDFQHLDTTKIVYSLGGIGECIKKSYQYGQVMPKELFWVRFNQINIFTMGLYISRMIFLNRKSSANFKCTISVKTLLSKIIAYNQQGLSLSMSYFDYLSSLDTSKRTEKVNRIEKQLIYILDLLEDNNKIIGYKFNGKMQYKYIRENETSIVIYLKEKKVSSYYTKQKKRVSSYF